MKILFWVSVGLVVYTFIVYPVILVFLASMKQVWTDLQFAFGRSDRRRTHTTFQPTVSLIIAAHNEQAVIAEKMQNCRELDYPRDSLDILVGCDGCTDDTVAQAQAVGLPNARIFDYPRSGKPDTLNRLVKEALGEILVFSDANTMYRPDAIRLLIRHFANPAVGAVCGNLSLMSTDGQPISEGLYWRYECFLKFFEGRLNMLVGANGAIFAIRGKLYEPLPPRTINDDFLTAMSIRARGHRVLYEPSAVGYEEAAENMQQEFRRRTRIGRGNLRALLHTWRLLNPAAGLIALSYWSHKIFRWAVPFAMLTAIIAAIGLSNQFLYAAAACCGLLLAGIGGLGYFRNYTLLQNRLIRAWNHFLLMNTALLVGFIADLFGSRGGAWNPTPRTSALPPAK